MKELCIGGLLLAFVLLGSNVWSQTMPNPGVAQPELRLRMIAIEGTTTGGSQLAVANSLRGLRNVLERLGPADTFTEVARREVPVQPDGETLVPINSRYRFSVTYPVATAEGRLETYARVEQRDGATVLNAIKGTVITAPGQSMIFRGLEGPTGGELILVMQFMQEQDQNQSESESTESDQPEESDQQEQSEEQESEEQEGEDEEQEAQPQPEEEGEESEQEEPQPEPESPLEEMEAGDESEQEPEELDNLEAILESLEEMDNREQMEMRNRPRRVQSAGDWW